MGLLVNGAWKDQWYDTKSTGGKFVRQKSVFRDRITADGSSGFKAEAGRYHLYVSLACPWAHRTLILRRLKKLEDVISISVVNPFMGEFGWTFEPFPCVITDPVSNSTHLHQVYTLAKPDYSGRVTVPVLFDKETKTILNNESADILRMFNSEFSAFTDVDHDFYPVALREEIDDLNCYVYENINNGVYKAGFATAQEAYEEAFENLFEALDKLEARLDGQEFLIGGQFTEADVRLFTTLARFDAVYVGHFKCNKKRIADYPNLQAFLERICNMPGVKETLNLRHIKTHYYGSHLTINPTGVVPKGPDLDFLS